MNHSSPNKLNHEKNTPHLNMHHFLPNPFLILLGARSDVERDSYRQKER